MINLLRVLLVTLFTILLLFSCIKRDNWWDPYFGCHPLEELPLLREAYTNSVLQELHKCDDVHLKYPEFQATLLSVKNGNSLQIEQNKRVVDSLLVIFARNDTIARQNSSRTKCTDALLQLPLPKTPLYRLTKKNPDPESSLLNTIIAQKWKIDSIITVAKNACGTQVVLATEFTDSVQHMVVTYKAEWEGVLGVINGYYNETLMANRYIDSMNNVFDRNAALVESYNDSISFCQLDKLNDTASIVAKLATIRPGESLVFAADTVKLENFQLKSRGSMGLDSGRIVIRGKPAGTVLQIVNGCEVANSSRIQFMNIVFSGTGNGVGIRIRQNCDSIIFLSCQFVNNRGYGLEIDHSRNIIIENCRILHNGETAENAAQSGKGGARISESGVVNLRNVLIAKNTPYGIDINKSPVDLFRCTVSDNAFDGIRYTGEANNGGVTATATIICYHNRTGVYRNDENVLQDIYVGGNRNNRFFSNSKDIDGDPFNVDKNQPVMIADPKFADRLNDDYRIGVASELFGRNIGYHY